MPRVRLQVWHRDPDLRCANPRRPGRVYVFPTLRLMARVLLGPDPTRGRADTRLAPDAIIDSGSPFSIIQSGTWELYRRLGLLELLPPPVDAEGLTIAGGSVGFQAGRMPVGVLDADASPGDRRRRLRAVPVLFLLPARPIPSLPHAILIGLHESILDGRWLIREPVAPVAGPENRYDTGLRYGQRWWLQDEPP